LSQALLTFMAAPAAGLDVGLMALTDQSPGGGDRLLTLQSRPGPNRSGCPCKACLTLPYAGDTWHKAGLNDNNWFVRQTAEQKTPMKLNGLGFLQAAQYIA
jgi:hypothetical protein